MPTEPKCLYIGKREAVITECPASEGVVGKYLLQLDGDYDASGADSLEEVKAGIAEVRAAFPEIMIIWL